MVADMLFLARADRGMIRLELEEIDVRREVESVAEYFEPAAAERGQRIETRGECRLRADRLLLRRAVTNQRRTPSPRPPWQIEDALDAKS